MAVQIRGLDRVNANLRALARTIPNKFGAALARRAEIIMTRSKREFVPVDQGVLRSTGHVRPVKQSGSTISVTLAYGGPAAPYAAVQHENTGFSHRVGQAKYLEQPVMEAAPTLPADVARDVDL